MCSTTKCAVAADCFNSSECASFTCDVNGTGRCGCAPGSYANANDGCSSCPYTEFSENWSTPENPGSRCLACPGTSDSNYQALAATTCWCFAGYTSTGANSCSACAPGTYRSYTDRVSVSSAASPCVTCIGNTDVGNNAPGATYCTPFPRADLLGTVTRQNASGQCPGPVGVENMALALFGPSGNFSTQSYGSGGFFEFQVGVFGNYTLNAAAPVGLSLVSTLPGVLDGNPAGSVQPDGSIANIRLQSASFAYSIRFCMSDAPTVTPTSSPSTRMPTVWPSAKPTSTPTGAPSAKPTSTPSAKPTSTQTGAPSAKPTSTPSAKPSRSPTSMPSGAPRSSPTTQPSQLPSTTSPTWQPVADPSSMPTPRPTHASTLCHHRSSRYVNCSVCVKLHVECRLCGGGRLWPQIPVSG